jgi:hypothetical protein
MTDLNRTTNTSSIRKQVRFSEVIHVIKKSTIVDDNVVPTIEQKSEDSVSGLSTNELVESPASETYVDSDEYHPKHDGDDDDDFAQPMLIASSVNNIVVTVDGSLRNDESSVPQTHMKQENNDDDSLIDDNSKHNEEGNGFMSYLFGAMGIMSFLTASGGMFGCLYKWFCSQQSLPADHDDVIAASALLSNVNKGFIFAMPGDGGTSYISYVLYFLKFNIHLISDNK